MVIGGGIRLKRNIPGLKTATSRENKPLDWLLLLELESGPSPSGSGPFLALLVLVAGLAGGGFSPADASELSEAREARSLFPAEYRFM